MWARAELVEDCDGDDCRLRPIGAGNAGLTRINDLGALERVGALLVVDNDALLALSLPRLTRVDDRLTIGMAAVDITQGLFHPIARLISMGKPRA